MCTHNEEVMMSHLRIKATVDNAKPMIVMHNFLGRMTNFRSLCMKTQIRNRRDCYLVEMRNHANSDHHVQHNYNVLAEDVIRFADNHNLNKVTLLGHGMGARTAMTAICKYPDRVDGAISIDTAPVNGVAELESSNTVTKEAI